MSNKNIPDNSLVAPRSKQNTSCNWTGTADFGRIVPFHIEELVPTEKVVTCRPKIELQMLPLASPTFGKLDLYIHYFFVPHRLTWKDYDDVASRQGVGRNAVPPYISMYDLANFYKTVPDSNKRAFFKHWTSLGLPPFFALADFQSNASKNTSEQLTMLKFRAYQQIWWDFFRDPEVLRDESKADYINDNSGHWSSTGAYANPNQNVLAPKLRSLKDSWIANLFSSPGSAPSGVEPFYTEEIDGDEFAISDGESSRRLRYIEAISRLSERLSLGGKRAIDALFAAYGVKPDFMKLNMAQYVGGAKSTVLVSDITSSADTVTSVGSENPRSQSGSPLGAKAGCGYSNFNSLNINYTAKEAGYLVGVFSVMPHVHYVQGIDKSWYRNSIDDFFTRNLERTGLVAVSKKEVGLNGLNQSSYNRTQDNSSFAFTQPYYEYKQGRDILAGDFMYYHNDNSSEDGTGNLIAQLQYMHSMEMYIDYPADRIFNSNNLLVNGTAFDKIFYYLGGSLWDDVDDHFHLCIDKEVIKDSPMDGFAVPTLETTADPHKATTSIGGDTVL